MRKILAILFIISFVWTQERTEIVSRHRNGQKAIVSVFSGSGLDEKIDRSYNFDPKGKLTYYYLDNFGEFEIDRQLLHLPWFFLIEKTSNGNELLKFISNEWEFYKKDPIKLSNKETLEGIWTGFIDKGSFRYRVNLDIDFINQSFSAGMYGSYISRYKRGIEDIDKIMFDPDTTWVQEILVSQSVSYDPLFELREKGDKKGFLKGIIVPLTNEDFELLWFGGENVSIIGFTKMEIVTK